MANTRQIIRASCLASAPLPQLIIGRTRVGTNLAYVPIIVPEPPSPARQLAYHENSPLLGLSGDPEGWKTLPTVSVTGTIFKARSVEIKYTVS